MVSQNAMFSKISYIYYRKLRYWKYSVPRVEATNILQEQSKPVAQWALAREILPAPASTPENQILFRLSLSRNCFFEAAEA